jgi:hypothetical protein
MSTTQRAYDPALYSSKLRREPDQTQYGRIPRDMPVATVAQPKRPASAWAIAIAVLLIGGIAIGQAR